MEKIMQFHSGTKVPLATRHIISPASYSNQSGVSDAELEKEGIQTLSPIYKKLKENPMIISEKAKENLKILQIPRNKYETDESEPNSPETNHSKTDINRAKKTLALYAKPADEKKEPETNKNEDEEEGIKELSLFNSTEQAQKKSPLAAIVPKKETMTKLKLPIQNQIEEAISDAEADKNSNVIYKEKEESINNHQFRHLIFSPTVTESSFRRFLVLTYRGLVYAKKCLKQPSEKFIRSKQVVLKDGKITDGKRKTLFLDLDETLVHTCPLKQDPEHVILVPAENGNKISVGINIRPYCLEFLEKMSLLYEIIIFTASAFDYATEIINFIDPERKYISGILVRENCMETKIGFFIKDLRIVKNRNLKDMIIVDNLAHSFGFQVENGIPILEYHDDKHDRELKHLCTYLIEACAQEDVREFNKSKLKLAGLADLKMEDIEI